MDVVIRKADKGDCKAIRSLIQELADYEKTPDAPKISVEVLEKDGFGDVKFFHCLVAEMGGELVGFTLYSFTYSTWEGRQVYMEDLYVQPQHRSKGIGTKLWKALVKDCLAIGCSRCNFSVLNWNQPSIEYYKRQGAVNLTEQEGWLSFRMDRKGMEEFVSKPDTADVVVRKAVKEDCQALRSLIQELADYEKMPEGPKISAEILQEDGFGDDKFFHCLVAEQGSELLGFVLYFFPFGWEGRQVYMEDLYVQPQHRSKGIGTKLWKTLVKDGIENGCSRCHFAVLDWNKPSIEYYKRQGAFDLTEKNGWLSFRMDRAGMEKFVSK